MIIFEIRNKKTGYLKCDETLCHDCVKCLHIKNTGRRKSPESAKNCRYLNNFNLSGTFTTTFNESFRNNRDENYRSYSESTAGANSYTSGLEKTMAVGKPSHTWLYMIVWLVSVLCYINGLTGDFVHDDISAITSNPDVTGRNPLFHVFLNDYWGKPLSHPLSHKSYRPLTILTFRQVLQTAHHPHFQASSTDSSPSSLSGKS